MYSKKKAKNSIRNNPAAAANITLRFAFGFMGCGLLVGG
jgi:hypothetical protein